MEMDTRKARYLVIGVIAGFLIGMVIIYRVARLRTPQTISGLTGGPGPTTKMQIDALAPDFELESLTGEKIQLAGLSGKIVLINFWATWCGPCSLEMPAFQSRYERFSEELVILAVNEHDTLEDIRGFMDELGLTFDAMLDIGGQVHRQYLVRGFPTSYLVDAEGILQVQHIGVMTEGQLDDYLAEVGLGE